MAVVATFGVHSRSPSGPSGLLRLLEEPSGSTRRRAVPRQAYDDLGCSAARSAPTSANARWYRSAIAVEV
jgi:hypothetical protein